MNEDSLDLHVGNTSKLTEVEPWWHDAVFYQIYPRSFACEQNRDGVGDIAGVISRLDYLSNLGVDALWLSPIFKSPQKDHGYDVSDYQDIDEIFGDLADFDRLVGQAHARDIKVTVDMVPNHSSDQHEWFQRAVAAGPGSPERDMYRFRDGRGANGQVSPTDVVSSFGGPAWTRIKEPDGSPGQWYFHLFAPEQPDLNWENPRVLQEFRDIWRFWLDRGVDGFRIDVADALTKDIGRDDVAEGHQLLEHGPESASHDVWRALRSELQSYGNDRTAVGEVWAGDDEAALYARPDEFPLTFNFPFMKANWDGAELRRTIDQALWRRGALGTPPTWVLESHDEPRCATRLAPDPVVGVRRARALALVLLSLPGVAYIYQGQELGLPNVDDLRDDVLQDPIWERSGHTDRGRDGCRVPIPWSGESAPYGFASDASIEPWLPQPDRFRELSVAVQEADEKSTLTLYRQLLALRRERPCLRRGAIAWLSSETDVLHYERQCEGDRVQVLVNLSDDGVPVPMGDILACSLPGDGFSPGRRLSVLPPNAAVWVGSR
jgi:alpha-glucosidase